MRDNEKVSDSTIRRISAYFRAISDLLAAADPANAGSAVVTIDLAEAREKSINSRNDLFGDRRVGEYGKDLIG